MAITRDLIPELPLWNNGKGIEADVWAFIVGRADHALGLCAMMWPEFVQFDGYILRGPLDLDRLRAWERGGHSRQQIETAMNAYLLEGMFPDDPTDEPLKTRQVEQVAATMADMLSAKLIRDFPALRFSAFVLDGDDFGISFHQVESC